MSFLLNPQHWRISPSNFPAELRGDSLREEISSLADALQADSTLLGCFSEQIAMTQPRLSPFFLSCGIQNDYLLFDLLDEVASTRLRIQLLQTVAVSPSALLPFDLRASAISRLKCCGEVDSLVGKWLMKRGPLPSQQIESDVQFRDTDGIDHLFEVPQATHEFVELLEQASLNFLNLRVSELLMRASLSAWQKPSPRDSLGDLISEQITEPLLCADDYLIPWDLVLAADSNGEPLTLAEICKAILLHPMAKLPLKHLRTAVVGFYRSVLGLPGRAVVGLGSGFLYVEHGQSAPPSYVFIGQEAILGKGVTIDTVGGCLIGRESFIGGGFLPVLIHTHKHLRASGASAASERERIQRAGFVIAPGARYPMGEVGLFECADYVGKPSRYPGVTVVDLSEKG